MRSSGFSFSRNHRIEVDFPKQYRSPALIGEARERCWIGIGTEERNEEIGIIRSIHQAPGRLADLTTF